MSAIDIALADAWRNRDCSNILGVCPLYISRTSPCSIWDWMELLFRTIDSRTCRPLSQPIETGSWLTKCIILCCQLHYWLFLRSREDEHWIEQEELEDHPCRPGASLDRLQWWHSIRCASVGVEHLDKLQSKTHDHQFTLWFQWASMIECCWKESFDLDL